MLPTVVLSCSAALTLTMISGAVATCPSGWVSFQNNCYFHHAAWLTNAAADAYCRSVNSFLVDIQSQAENDFVMSFQQPGSNDVWSGYHTTVTISTRADFTWDRTGTTGTYQNWVSHEPNNNRNDDGCVTLSGSPDPLYRGKWSDYPCVAAFQFVCKQVSAGVNVTVNCTTHQMSFIVRKSLLYNAQASELRLNDGVCQPQESGDYLQFSWGLSSCGNNVSYTANKTIYTNTVSNAGSAAAVIVRKNAVSFTVMCSYENNGVVSSGGGFQPIAQQTVFTESGFGTFTMSIQVTDKTYTNPVSSFPLQVSLNDYLYFKLNVQSSDSQLDLFAVSCYATPLVSPTSSPQYEFLKEDCALDQTMFVNASSQDSITFGIQAFQFIGHYSYVYVHCSLTVCHSTSSGNRCSQGCLQAGRKRRQTKSYVGASQVHTISQGPFVQQTSTPTGNQPRSRSGSSNVQDTTVTVLLFLFLSIMAVF